MKIVHNGSFGCEFNVHLLPTVNCACLLDSFSCSNRYCFGSVRWSINCAASGSAFCLINNSAVSVMDFRRRVSNRLASILVFGSDKCRISCVLQGCVWVVVAFFHLIRCYVRPIVFLLHSILLPIDAQLFRSKRIVLVVCYFKWFYYFIGITFGPLYLAKMLAYWMAFDSKTMLNSGRNSAKVELIIFLNQILRQYRRHTQWFDTIRFRKSWHSPTLGNADGCDAKTVCSSRFSSGKIQFCTWIFERKHRIELIRLKNPYNLFIYHIEFFGRNKNGIKSSSPAKPF